MAESEASNDGPGKHILKFKRLLLVLKSKLNWIPQNWTESNIKTVIRCSVVGWISTVLFVIPPVELFLGQASFLIIIAAFFSPPSDPFICVLEREILILLFVAIGWAWVCLGLFLADLTREVRVPDATIFDVATGQYIEAAPTVILAIFLFFGSVFFVYIRARQGPGPYLSASVFACLCIDICITTAVLFPYPFYLVGRSIMIPLAFHSALSLFASIVIFPSTVCTMFTSRLIETISPSIVSLDLHQQLLSSPLSEPAFNEILRNMQNETKQCEGKLVPLAAAGRLLGSDLIFSRFGPADFRAFQAICGRLAARADGMAMYFVLIDPNRERFLGTDNGDNESPVPTVPPTPERRTSRESLIDSAENSRHHDREGLPVSSEDSATSISHTPQTTTTSAALPRSNHTRHAHTLSSQLHGRSHVANAHEKSHRHRHSHSEALHHSLLSLAKARSKRQEHAVGVFEAQKYLNFEFTRFHDPDECLHTERLNTFLKECSVPLVIAARGGLSVASEWLQNIGSNRISHIWDTFVVYLLGPRYGISAKTSADERCKLHDDRIANVKRIKEDLVSALQVYRNDTRHIVLELYRVAFDDSSELFMNLEKKTQAEMPPHRYLFHCYLYQYHLIFLASEVIEMLTEILRLEDERPWPKCRLWTPVENTFRWNGRFVTEQFHEVDDEDPDTIQSLGAEPRNKPGAVSHSIRDNDLGLPYKRDPDALPPRNVVESFFAIIYNFFSGPGGGNVAYAVKAGLLTVVLSLPCLLKGSAHLAYENRFVWAVFMGQLTLARFRGDTAFGLIARLISTFTGGVVGLIMWYISAGSGDGNPYGFAAVCAFCFPFFFYARLYWPIQPMINLIIFVTVILVIGYSYQDSLILLPGSPGAGFSVAWRRFVLVNIGVFVAFFASLLPPSTTIRKYQRKLLSTTSSQLGSIYCSILSFANTKNEPDVQEILSSLVALRSKLKKSTELRTNVAYEFSLRGCWPVDRYQKITDLQIALAYSLSHLVSVIKHLEPSWALAFLRRTRFMDPDFQGDLLSVISMVSSSLRTGCPLPQITPCPLIDRFTLKYHGLNVIHKDSEVDYGLPRTLTHDVLKNEQYLMFCVGISTAFGIINRLDRLMMAVKEVVGEQYHIHGIGVPQLLDTPASTIMKVQKEGETV